jgi:hypothetical protein
MGISRLSCIGLALGAMLLSHTAPAMDIHPIFEQRATREADSSVDRILAKAHAAQGIEPGPLCSDAVFVRRAYLDVIGVLPTPQEVLDFLDDPGERKREELIDKLLERPEFPEYWSLKWGDILRVKSEYPVNLWPNAVQAYHRWVLEALRDNMPHDAFARALLTSSGSNFRVAPVNFHRAVQSRTPDGMAGAASLVFMGTRYETWPGETRENLAAFFSRVTFKPTAEWKEEIVINDPSAIDPLDVTFPDGTSMTVAPGQDPRALFAAWLTMPDNPWFARTAVNRAWYWLLGRGIVHEPDDFGPHNPPRVPELLDYLADELVRADHDLRHIYRIILRSHAYQRSAIPRGDPEQAEAWFAAYPTRRLDAEVLLDAINDIFGGGDPYDSPIPEPFTFIPESNRAVLLADGSITSPFLEMFGRPARDTGLHSERNNEPTEAQRLYLLNSSEIHQKMGRSQSMRALSRRGSKNPGYAIRALYLMILSRPPTREEQAAIFEQARAGGGDTFRDTVWALINAKEFLYRH